MHGEASAESVPPLVGSVHESNAQHWQRHSCQLGTAMCCRCNFIRHKSELLREQPWCTERPLFMGGRWRLGCDVCRWMSSACTKKEKHAGRRGCNIRASIFAKHEFVYNGSYFDMERRIAQHATHSGHRAASIAAERLSQRLPARFEREPKLEAEPKGMRPLAQEMRPLASEEIAGDEVVSTEAEQVVTETVSEVLADTLLLKGRVPQAQDWVDAWVESTEQVAFHKQERLYGKKRALRWNNLRRVRRKQVRIMAEVRRQDVRKRLREATCISFSMDDRQYQKVVRFRCDAPAKPFVHRGVLGVMTLEKSALGDFEEDHALIAVRKMDSFLNKVFTPLGPKCRPLATDFALKEHVLKCARVFAVDGASKERRAVLLAVQELFPNVVLLLRDAAHALRIAIKDPLHFDDLFGEVWKLLFDKRHALVPDVMNSKKWQDLLQHIQKEVLRIPAESRPLEVVLQHLRFAKQRFDSVADPMAKVAFMLLPLATMLAFVGSDERHKPCDRERAKELLKKLDSKFALAIGLSADWGLVTQAFIRLFDKNSHDIAKTYSEIRAFKEVLRCLFEEGSVFYSTGGSERIRQSKLPAIGGFFGKQGVKPMFVTQHIEHTLRRRVVFNCGSEQVLLWGPPKEEDVREASERLKFITAHVIDRVDAEFGPLNVFRCFDVAELRTAFTCTDEAEGLKARQILQRQVRTIATDLRVDGVEAALEYRQVAELIVELTSPGRPLATATNSEVWQAMLEPSVRLSHLPQRSTMRCLSLLIRFYISIEDGECVVERDLGVLSGFMRAHKIAATHMDGTGELADDLMLARSDVIDASDIRVGGLAVGSCARLGPKGRRWAALWRAVYGARLGCYSKAAKRQRGKRAGTYEAAKAGVLAAAEYAVATKWQRLEGTDSVTPFGVRKSCFKAALGAKADVYNNKALQRFKALTIAKKLRAQAFLRRCAAKRIQEKRAAKHAEALEGISAVCFIGEVGATLPRPVSEGTRLKEVTGRTRCLKADLAVVDDLSRLHECPEDSSIGHSGRWRW